jgi:hypothetical protein
MTRRTLRVIGVTLVGAILNILVFCIHDLLSLDREYLVFTTTTRLENKFLDQQIYLKRTESYGSTLR